MALMRSMPRAGSRSCYAYLVFGNRDTWINRFALRVCRHLFAYVIHYEHRAKKE